MAHAEQGQDTFLFDFPANPLAYIRLEADDTVTVISKSMEAGQGIHTTHATLVAEELDATPAQMRVVAAPGEPGITGPYGNVLMGGIQGTGGQTGTQSSFLMYRKAGAAMRQMLLRAAAEALAVPQGALTIEQGEVRHTDSGQHLRFGALAAAAMAQPVPESVTLKTPDQFVYIGRHFPRVDLADKVRGKTVYTQDLVLPGMLVALVERPSRLGGKVERFDASAALRVPGVRHVVRIGAGVAVVAEGYWAAEKGRQLLRIDWDNNAADRSDTRHISLDLNALLDEPGTLAKALGDVNAAAASATRTLRADYEVPYQAHAAMETLNGVMQVTDQGIEIWGGSQIFGFDSIFITQAAQIPIERVRNHTLPVGGTFGRRYGPDGALWIELLEIIRAIGTQAPVKLMLSRADDFSVNTVYYRPGYAHRIEASVDAQGRLIALKHRIAGQSMLAGTLMAQGMVHEGIDFMSVESSVDLPYQVPNQRVELHSPTVHLHASPTRFGGTLHNGFANECMIDEVAHALRRDPIELRLELLPAGNRERGCLELARAQAGWDQPLAAGPAGARRGRGVAVTPSHRSYSACVAEVTVHADQSWQIDRLVVALDCGLVVNPKNLRSQIDGGCAFAISLARYNEVTVKDGVAQETNFDQYPMVRWHTMAKRIEACFVASNQPPSGAGETIGSSVVPAIANALFNATGVRLRKLPLRLPGERAEGGWERPARLNGVGA